MDDTLFTISPFLVLIISILATLAVPTMAKIKRRAKTSVLVPERNKNDLIDLTEEAQKLLEIKLVETIDDVLELGLLEAPPSEERKGERRSGGIRVTTPLPPSTPPSTGEARR